MFDNVYSDHTFSLASSFCFLVSYEFSIKTHLDAEKETDDIPAESQRSEMATTPTIFPFGVSSVHHFSFIFFGGLGPIKIRPNGGLKTEKGEKLMFKQLLSQKRLFYGLVCFLVFIAAGWLYLNRVKSQAKRDVQGTQEIVEEHQTPKTEAEPATGGHSHPNGTFHAGPHESDAPSTAPVETEVPRRAGVSPGAPAVSKPVPPHLSTTLEAASGRTLDPQTQKKVDTLYAEAERLSAESTIWSNKLYAEYQDYLKEKVAIKAEIEKLRAMPSQTPEEKQKLSDSTDAFMPRYLAVKAKGAALNDRYLENRERHEEYMRLIKEARALGGTR